MFGYKLEKVDKGPRVFTGVLFIAAGAALLLHFLGLSRAFETVLILTIAAGLVIKGLCVLGIWTWGKK